MNVISPKVLSQIELFYHPMLSVYLEEEKEEEADQWTPPRRMNISKNQVYRMEAGSANSDYVDFQVLTYHRDFTITVFLCECFLMLRLGKVC